MALQTGDKQVLTIENKQRKSYRAALEISKSLDEIYKSQNAFVKIFEPETTLLREKLRQYCEMLIFRQPLEYGKKAEEILWRKVFYEIINIVKSGKKKLKSNSEVETMYRLHLNAAFGYYNQLILRLQIEFHSNLNLDGFLDFPIPDKSSTSFSSTIIRENYHHLKELITKILHKFLICLGDLARYQIEYDPRGSTKLSQKYYYMALLLLPENGMPLNQMGTLSGSDNYGCDSAYYYLYCLSCIQSFAGAKDNLKLLFFKNRKRYDEIKSTKYLDRTKIHELQLKELHSKEIKKFLVLFLHIIELFMSNYLEINASNTINTNELQELCQICLQEFNACMFFKSATTSIQSEKGENLQQSKEKLSYLPNELVFKLAAIVLMAIERMKRHKHAKHVDKANNPSLSINNNTVLITAIAFALMFLSHIVNHTIMRFQADVLNFDKEKEEKQQQQKLQDQESSGREEEDDDDDSDDSDDSDEYRTKIRSKKDNASTDGSSIDKRKKVNLIFSRRRRQRNSDSETNSQESNDESDDDRRHRLNNRSKFIERDYLSEGEMNLSSDEDEYDEEDEKIVKKKSSGKNVVPKSTESSSDSPHSEIETKQPDKNLNKFVDDPKQELQEPPALSNYLTKIPPNTQVDANFILNQNETHSNFKEFSTQLFTNYFMFDSKFDNTSTTINDQGDFMDNEIYKSVLSGRMQVSVPPGFENNEKEAQEIEELGKKIATFQIETDTEMSTFNSDTNNLTSSESSESEESVIEVKHQQSSNLNEKEIQTVIGVLHKQGLLPTIKVFCDWLLCNRKLIQSISQVPQTIWSKLAILLNCIPSERTILNSGICENQYVKNLISKSMETILWNTQPLSEDIQLRSFDGLKIEHSSLKYDLNNLSKLSAFEETLVRVCCLRRFGYSITSLLQSHAINGACFFTYNASQESFVAVAKSTEKTEESKPTQQQLKQSLHHGVGAANKSNDEDPRLKLMKEIAKLKLQDEINSLETSSKCDELNLSPYIIPEVNALCHNLKIIQELSRANKFIIIIPIIVIDNLDSMKKDSKLAREAIRWLENQYKQGNRFIRAQDPTETIIKNRQLNLKSKDIEAWRISQLLDCCKYFQKQKPLVADKERSFEMVTLLTNNDETDNNEQQKLRINNLLNNARKENIFAINIVEFYNKWKLMQQASYITSNNNSSSGGNNSNN